MYLYIISIAHTYLAVSLRSIQGRFLLIAEQYPMTQANHLLTTRLGIAGFQLLHIDLEDVVGGHVFVSPGCVQRVIPGLRGDT